MIEDIFDKVFVISLPDASDRRKYVKGHLCDNNIKGFEFHDATGPQSSLIDDYYKAGKVHKFPPCFRCGKNQCENEKCNNVLIRPQIAVFLTYLSLWEKISRLNCTALILEDDIKLQENWKNTLDKLIEEIMSGNLSFKPNEPRLLRLGWALCTDHTSPKGFEISNDIKMSNPCHAITSAFAQKMLDRFKTINTTVDIYQHKDAPENNEAVTIWPPLASELSWSTGEVDSLIHPKTVRTEYLKKQGLDMAASENEKKISEHIKHMYYRDFLLVGHPRCGTGFIASLFSQFGLDIGHESDGKDGLSSWMFAVEDESPYWGEQIAKNRSGLHWNYLIHVVRNLTTAVPSVMRDNIYAPPSYAFRRKHILKTFQVDLNEYESNFEKAIISIIFWNKIIKDIGPNFVFRLEYDLQKVLDFISTIHIPYQMPEKINLTPVNANKKYKGKIYAKPVITESDWINLCPKTWGLVTEYCQQYGYKLPIQKERQQRV